MSESSFWDCFPETQWILIANALDSPCEEAQAALAYLCNMYWYPVYAFIRRKGYDADSALDLTQEYFARLLESPLLAAADRSKGRFRDFLRADCAFFLSHRREQAATQKRGGRVSLLSIDARDAEGRYCHEPVDAGLTPERLFDRSWARELLDSVLSRLAHEQAEAGQSERFAVLRERFDGDRFVPSAVLAERLGISEAAVDQAVSRLRKRYRTLLREQIAATLEEPSEEAIDDEVRTLFALFES